MTKPKILVLRPARRRRKPRIGRLIPARRKRNEGTSTPKKNEKDADGGSR